MTEIVLDARTLPEPIFRLIRTEKVKIRECDGEIRLTPVGARFIAPTADGRDTDTIKGCPLRGMFADGKISVDKFIESKRAENESNLQNFAG